MDVLNDILKAQQEQTNEIEALKEIIKSLEEQVTKPIPKPTINLDAKEVANSIASQLLPKTNTFTEQAKKLQEVAQSLPKEITTKQEKQWGIDMPTKVWAFLLLLFSLLGYLLAPKAVIQTELEITKAQLKKREEQIQIYRDNNPKYGDKYFGN